jgi:carboxyl-terminal processing protease
MDMEGFRQGLRDYKSTTRDVRRILEDFDSQGVDAVILDLRHNGGGSLSEAIHLTGLFIDEGPVVQVKDGSSRVQAYHDTEPGTAWSGPLVVLIDKFSASASEILAGAVQDYDRGLIVGDHATHGKGTVQSLTDLGEEFFRDLAGSPEMGALKITMQQFYRPNGDSTQKRGVLADIELPSLSTHLDVGEADLDFPVEFDRVEPREFKGFGFVDEAICNRLRHLSEQRRQDSEDFQRLLENIDRYEEQKARKYVTLNEEQFLKERAELDAEKEEERVLEEVIEPEQTTIERTYYLDEALAITVDYLSNMQVAGTN